MKSKINIDDIKHLPISRNVKSQKRTLVKSITKYDKNTRDGLIICVVGRVYYVKDSINKIVFACDILGTINSPYKKSSIAVVGDFVKFNISEERNDDNLFLGSLVEVLERKSKLCRKSAGKADREQVIASNIDLVVAFFSAADPYYNRRLIDRYLVVAEENNLEVIILVNKIDLMDLDFLKNDFKVYQELGYSVFFISLIDEDNDINEFTNFLKNKNSIITGPSGVGKSTFVNKIFGDEIQVVGEISERTTKGQHTTSFVKLFNLPNGGNLVDSPGIREFGLWEFEKSELALFFHDFDKYRDSCKYKSCTHSHEPSCSVIEAYNNKLIDSQRYESYLSLFSSL
ncbi:MAG: ribosome small subunit-dependent GTPase A [Candidatus Kapabacteria bacterium]|nr:ribosome small subunit-dependent GTPase A [Candidatus Kapabacteria bacterium]